MRRNSKVGGRVHPARRGVSAKFRPLDAGRAPNTLPAPPLAARHPRFASLPDSLPSPGLRGLIRRALREDVGSGDITSRALVAPGRMITAVVVARHACIVCGVSIAAQVFRELDPGVRVRVLVPDGCRARRDAPLMRITGKARAILAGERIALNFLQHLTGIATLTARFVERVRPHGTRILDTRKTTPTWRALEKYAVRCGGGTNHRMGLYDQVLIKDNHRRLWGARDLGMAVRTARRRCPGAPVEVEVETEAELERALAARPDWILLDNMTPNCLRRCVHLCHGRCPLEASGGITLANVKAVAAAGVQAISLGCLTHSAPAADLSLEISDARTASFSEKTARQGRLAPPLRPNLSLVGRSLRASRRE